MSSDKKINRRTNIQEDENGTLSLAPLLPKEFWGDKVKKWYEPLPKFFAHPFIILAVGALLTSLLLPYITSKWQNHQKELDIKSTLVTQITQSSNKVFIELESFLLGEVPLKSQVFNHYLDVVNEWEIDSSATYAQLKAYYPQTFLSSEWDGIRTIMFGFYRLNIDKRKEQRQLDTEIIQKILSALKVKTCVSDVCVNWNNLVEKYEPLQNGDGLLIMTSSDWAILEYAVKDEINRFIQEVLQTPISVYS